MNTNSTPLRPCAVCGYNGPGFYSPAAHPCAEREMINDNESLKAENERLRAALGEAEYAVTTLRAEMQRLVDWAEAETANNEPEDPAHPHRAHSRVRAARSVLKGTGKL